jgi:transporter family-2 protein
VNPAGPTGRPVTRPAQPRRGGPDSRQVAALGHVFAPPGAPARITPATLALPLVVLGGVASAAQGTVNAELGARVGNPAMGAVVNNLVGCLLVLAGLAMMPSMRSGLRTLRRAGPPAWAYLGGLGGAAIVLIASYVVPVLGVAVFTIAQVAGNTAGGLVVDRGGLAGSRLPVTVPRLAGAGLGLVAVALAQVGRPVGEPTAGLTLLAVVGGLAVALQAALNGRLAAVGGAGAGTAVNFLVGTPVVLVVAAVGATATGVAPIPSQWPTGWFLYTGGLLGVFIVVALLVGVRSLGVLRTGLAIVAGQLGGALLLDTLVPGGPGVRLPVLVGALLTLMAVAISGIGRGSAGAVRAGAGGNPGTPGA